MEPTVEDVVAYLGDGSSWTEDEVSSALLAEAAAQRARCRVPAAPDPFPEDLAEALKRRVSRNLHMRNAPLGLTGPDIQSGTQAYIGSDQETKRLEAPHRRLVVG